MVVIVVLSISPVTILLSVTLQMVKRFPSNVLWNNVSTCPFRLRPTNSYHQVKPLYLAPPAISAHLRVSTPSAPSADVPTRSNHQRGRYKCCIDTKPALGVDRFPPWRRPIFVGLQSSPSRVRPFSCLASFLGLTKFPSLGLLVGLPRRRAIAKLLAPSL